MSKKIKIISQTTPHHKMLLRSWLAELVMVRTHGTMKPFFWRDSRWKGDYTREVRAVSKFIKKYGAQTVVNVAEAAAITTFTNYAELEWRLQEYDELARLKRLRKDFTPTEVIQGPTEDFREPRNQSKVPGLFERLDELNGH